MALKLINKGYQMLKSKTEKIVIAFSIFAIILFCVNTNYAKYFITSENDDTNWNIAITSDTKEINDTQEISFKIQENPNVVKGKIAPGLKATAEIEIDLKNTKDPIDIKANVDTTSLNDCFELTSTIINDNYTLGTVKTLKQDTINELKRKNEKVKLVFQLEWTNNFTDNAKDTIIGSTVDRIRLPITVNVTQNIDAIEVK